VRGAGTETGVPAGGETFTETAKQMPVSVEDFNLSTTCFKALTTTGLYAK
jgi:hypothetical protein